MKNTVSKSKILKTLRNPDAPKDWVAIHKIAVHPSPRSTLPFTELLLLCLMAAVCGMFLGVTFTGSVK